MVMRTRDILKQERAIARHRNDLSEAMDTVHYTANRRFPGDIGFASSCGAAFLGLIKQEYSIDAAVTRVTKMIERHTRT